MSSHSAAARRGQALDQFAKGNLAFINEIALLGAFVVWPMYQSIWFVVATAVAIIAGNFIAIVAQLKQWSPWRITWVTAASYIVGALAAASPLIWASVGEVAVGVLSVITAPVTGWKDILTLSLPLGAYRTTLALSFVLFLVVLVIAITVVLRTPKRWAWSLPLLVSLPTFGIIFGSSATSQALVLGPIVIPFPRELLLGALTVLLLIIWMNWRTRSLRRIAIDVARSGQPAQARSVSRSSRNMLLSSGMLVLATVVGVALTPGAVGSTARNVPRTWVDPVVQIQDQLSPLSTFRVFQSDQQFDAALFRVETNQAQLNRVRIATMAFFNGEVATILNPSAGDGDSSTAFRRIPQAISYSTNGQASADFTIENYNQIWVPTVGSLNSISFTGANRQALSDSFYFNSNTLTGVALAGLAPGDSYQIEAQFDSELPAAAELQPSLKAGQIATDLVPDSLGEWIQAQDAPTGGAGLEMLIQRLRNRGYLSHALTIDAAAPPKWMQALPGYTFEPSRAGHSTGRIDQLFTSLLEKQNQVGGTDDAALVAAAGDDEQFVVAAAMIADYLGFPVRIALGATLGAAASDQEAAPCVEGECTGANMTAWIEVQDASGVWVPISVTPQHTNPLAPDVQQQQDPKHATEVDPAQAVAQPPAAAQPGQGDGTDMSDSGGVNLSWLWNILRVLGWVVLIVAILLGPFAIIIGGKLLRRRSRRDAEGVIDRFIGGWDEYVDMAVDFGFVASGNSTRVELAHTFKPAELGTPMVLARWTDRAVFAPDAPSSAEADEFWQIVDRELLAFEQGLTKWQRIIAWISLKSFARLLASNSKVFRWRFPWRR